MRTIAEWNNDEIKFSIMQWHSRYIVRAECFGLEQAFRLDVTEVNGPEQLRAKLDDTFVANVRRRFAEMGKSWSQTL